MAVDLQSIQRQVAQVRQGAGSDPEVIQCHAYAQVVQQAQLLAGFFRVAHQGLFRDLDFQVTRLQAMALQHLAQLGDQVGHAELRTAQADAEHQVLGKQGLPGFALPGAAMVNPAAQATDQPRLLQQWQKQPRGDIANARMLPAQQGLEATNPPVGNRNLRLIHQIEIPVLDGCAHTFFQHQPRARPAVHFMIVEAILLAAGTLGLVHGNVGRPHHPVEIGATIRERGNADAGTQSDIEAVDLLTDRHSLDELLGNLRRLLGELQIQQRGELVAAHPRQNVEGPQASLQLFGDPAQHPIAGIVPERIIDSLEAVEIQVHQDPGTVGTLTAQQQVLYCLIEPPAVEQSGQRIGDRLKLQLLMQMAHHRHVQHGHDHRMLLGGQWRAGQGHRHLLPGRRT
ncbi:hypothetical protein D3C72_841730 [compost metagenome]